MLNDPTEPIELDASDNTEGRESITPETDIASMATIMEAKPASATSTESDKPNMNSNSAGCSTGENESTRNHSDPCFDDFELSHEVQQAIRASGYQQPTPVQAEIIPWLLQGRDVMAQSQTGSGKTAAFALPILSRIKQRGDKPHTLVLAPTRELAIQVAKSFSKYGANLPDFSVAAIYGGQDYEPQLKQLRRGVQVVVGTPGRVIDHIKRGTLNLSQLEYFVLDEADEMLNMGFLEDVEFILKEVPKTRQTALFSATLPKPIREIAKQYLDQPAKVTIKQKTMTADSIRHRAVFVAPRDKVDLLTRFLEAEKADGTIVFTRTKDTTNVVAEKLIKAGYNALALNGDMPQRNRERAVQRLKAGQLDILVATDVAARGLDVSRISHVFNFDLPEGSESYTHRVGRTGRAGRSGEAIIFLTQSQRNKLRLIEKTTRQKIEIVEPPSTKEINAMRITRFKEQISQAIAEDKLKFHLDVIRDYCQETEQPADVVAAAVMKIGQQGRDFLVKDRPKRDRKSRQNDHFTDRGKGHSKHGTPKPGSGMARYRLAVGKRDGVRPGNIVGAVANEAGIEGDSIGPIQIYQSYTTIDLPQDLPMDIQEILREAWVSGRQLKMRPAGEDESRVGKNGQRKKRYGEKNKWSKKSRKPSKQKNPFSSSAKKRDKKKKYSKSR
ncbi:MAG: DEAD/DEAH box helicase [Mariniblastus sp.]|nr:DEAD/DEAH box helicase [Mariniblastus sp.]